MIITYAGRRMGTNGKPGYYFARTEDGDGDLLGFGKPPRMSRGWPVGTRFEADEDPASPGSWIFEKVLPVGEIDPRVPEWVAQDRIADTIVEQERVRKSAKADEAGSLDHLTLGELRAMVATAMPSRRRALLAIVIDRLT